MSLNQTPNDPSLADLLDEIRRRVMLDLNCHLTGTIESFNSALQTCTVTVNYTRTYMQTNSATGVYGPVQVQYPLLIDCPVVVLGGGSSYLTFPIAAGDECLLLCNDRDIDNWFATGQTGGPPNTSRLHSLSDAVALVGINSTPNIVQNYDAARAVLRSGIAGTTMVGVGATLIKIANATTTLNTLLQAMVTDIKNLTNACAAITVTGVTSGGAVSGPPVNASTITAIATNLTTLGTQIGGLLE